MAVDGARGGLVCGAVTVAALGLVFAALSRYQVPDYADQDVSLGLVGALFGSVGAAAVIAVIRRQPGWARGHVVVPLILVPAAVLPLVTGLERDNIEAVAIWGAAAIGVHTLLEKRRAALAGVALVLVGAVLLTWACQHRWRAHKFEAVGLPLYAPELPGYHVDRTWAGRYTVSMTLRPDGRDVTHYVDAVIRENPRCRNGTTERETSGSTLIICLPGKDGVAMTIKPSYPGPDLSPLFERTSVREVDGSFFANYRNGGEMEPD
ncbi:hypothetical protein M1L60_19040 [Actinoplanes sp. TRM 88003]|uniref:Uncharacterized protein n=1 Tax=Paractinoplanes aksuensis TaxID=2939490 RepID=A0ABT1DPC1_9ACTN|nr:hypothetical protein [Actinoplanes aksuensis]MCO8272693.1 hypothetical protein [Actinoplanes aksuensis]